MNKINRTEWLQMNLNDFISLEYHVSKNNSFKYHLTPKILFTLRFSFNLILRIDTAFKGDDT